MIFKIKNTKTGEEKEMEAWELDKEFWCECFDDRYMLKSKYESFFILLDNEEEQQEFIENCKKCEICDDKEYYTKMIEYDEWCSPRGIEPKWEVIEVK